MLRSRQSSLGEYKSDDIINEQVPLIDYTEQLDSQTVMKFSATFSDDVQRLDHVHDDYPIQVIFTNGIAYSLRHIMQKY